MNPESVVFLCIAKEIRKMKGTKKNMVQLVTTRADMIQRMVDVGMAWDIQLKCTFFSCCTAFSAFLS